jgi:hypothetical protein
MLRKNISDIGLLVAIPLFFAVAMNIIEAQAVEPVLKFDEKWIGDYDAMAKRNTIRALVPYSKTFNKMLFSFASYNAGMGKVAKLRKKAQKTGLDPNIWFRNVEIIVAKRIGRKTVQYVGNIFK